MRKKIRPLPEKGKSSAESFHHGTVAVSVPSHNRALSDLSEQRTALGRPTWAGFEMENAFWDHLDAICDSKGMSQEAFVERALALYGDAHLSSAVRIAITETMRTDAGWLPTPLPNYTLSLNEPRPADPTDSPLLDGG